jgi:hypothetical protein
LLILAGLLLTLLALIAALVFDTEAAVQRITVMTPADMARAQAVWQRVDPRQMPAGTVARIGINTHDLDLLLNEAAQRLLRGAVEVRMRTQAADVSASVRVPRLPVPLWINLHGTLRESAFGIPELAELHVGRLPVPKPIVAWAVQRTAEQLGVDEPLRLGLGMVQEVGLHRQGLTVAMRWSPAFADSLRAALVPEVLHPAMQAQTVRLTELLARQPPPAATGAEPPPVALSTLIPPLFDLARDRSLRQGPVSDAGEPPRAVAAQENRAALIVLAMHTLGQPLQRLVPAARDWPQPPARIVWLASREDHPQHLLVSAVLAAEGGGRLADTIGVLKEVADRSTAGSGFSFDDIAADRAGTRLGQRAVQDPIAFQQRMRAVRQDSDVMPPIDGLPSFLDDVQFRQQIGSESSERYRALIQLIEQRVAAVPVLR